MREPSLVASAAACAALLAVSGVASLFVPPRPPDAWEGFDGLQVASTFGLWAGAGGLLLSLAGMLVARRIRPAALAALPALALPPVLLFFLLLHRQHATATALLAATTFALCFVGAALVETRRPARAALAAAALAGAALGGIALWAMGRT